MGEYNDVSVLNVIFLWYDTVTKCPSVQEFGVPFMETSAKSGLNVELAFTAVAKWVTQFPKTDEFQFGLAFTLGTVSFWSAARTSSPVPCWLSYLKGDISVVLPTFASGIF